MRTATIPSDILPVDPRALLPQWPSKLEGDGEDHPSVENSIISWAEWRLISGEQEADFGRFLTHTPCLNKASMDQDYTSETCVEHGNSPSGDQGNIYLSVIEGLGGPGTRSSSVWALLWGHQQSAADCHETQTMPLFSV